jgi:UDP-glucose 4-epimerase
MRAADMGKYYCVSADSRDLNYDKYFVDGKVENENIEAYTSHNTLRLDVKQTIDKLMTTDYVQSALNQANT